MPNKTRDFLKLPNPKPAFEQVLKQQRRQWYQTIVTWTIALLVIVVCCFLVGLLDGKRLSDGVPSIFNLLRQMLPPDFSNARNWGQPLFDTLAMSIAGTAIAIIFSIPLSLLAARNTTIGEAGSRELLDSTKQFLADQKLIIKVKLSD